MRRRHRRRAGCEPFNGVLVVVDRNDGGIRRIEEILSRRPSGICRRNGRDHRRRAFLAVDCHAADGKAAQLRIRSGVDHTPYTLFILYITRLFLVCQGRRGAGKAKAAERSEAFAIKKI